MIHPPKFWKKRNFMAWVLLPLAGLFGVVSAVHVCWRGRRVAAAGVPVISVGNLTVGGSGKTPLVAWLAQQLAAEGKKVAILSRGYGGELQGVQVAQNHTAADVGDEPLMLLQQLAGKAAVWVGKNRKTLAAQAVAAGAEVIILDDGFQYTGLKRDCNILVVGEGGFGNRWPMPAGPLREFMPAARRADCVVHYGPAPKGVHCPAFKAEIKSQPPLNKPLFLFAGLGDTQKFFTAVLAAGGQVVGTKTFADHHAYSPEDITHIKAEAKKLGATPATTHKDAVKLPAKWGGAVVGVQLAGDGLAGLKGFVLNKF